MPGPLGPVGSADGSANASVGRSTSGAFCQLRPGIGGVGDAAGAADAAGVGEADGSGPVDAAGLGVVAGPAQAIAVAATSVPAANAATRRRWDTGSVSRRSSGSGNRGPCLALPAGQGRKNAPRPPPGCMTGDFGWREGRGTGPSVRTSTANQRARFDASIVCRKT